MLQLKASLSYTILQRTPLSISLVTRNYRRLSTLDFPPRLSPPMIDNPNMTGYYRCTDIWFEWPTVISDEEDRWPLKASIAYDALVHPDHPLRLEGRDGIELYMGTLKNDENRLLFSSGQIDYIRYWLHAMKLTKELLPIPNSYCLLTLANLKGVSPVVYKTATSLKKAVKEIQKNNKRLTGTLPILSARRTDFEKIRTFYLERKGVWIAVDFESWDRDHSLLTEFGWSLVRWEDRTEVEEYGHRLVKERLTYRNTYVPNYQNNYNFGTSEIINKIDFKTFVRELIADQEKHGPVFLVFHDHSQDIKYLRSSIEADLSRLSFELPSAPPSAGMFVIDTSEMFSALEGEETLNKRSLQQMCRLLGIETQFLHNAGNDAHYTMLALKTMASGDPLDAQREQRWPNRVQGNVKVQFKAWEEDGDAENPLDDIYGGATQFYTSDGKQ